MVTCHAGLIHSQGSDTWQDVKAKGEKGSGMYVAANHIFIGNSISPTYGADLYPDAGLLSRSANCVSNWKSNRRTSFTMGAERRKIHECEAAEKKCERASISLPRWSERAPTYLLYTSLWCLGNSSAYQCYCTTLNSFMQLVETRTGSLFPLPFPAPLSNQKYRCFSQRPTVKTIYRAEAVVDPYFCRN